MRDAGFWIMGVNRVHTYNRVPAPSEQIRHRLENSVSPVLKSLIVLLIWLMVALFIYCDPGGI